MSDACIYKPRCPHCGEPTWLKKCHVCKRHADEKLPKNPDVLPSELNDLLSANDKTYLANTLNHCKTKLQVYRAHSNGEYSGGMEYTALIKLIEETHDLFCS